jgi:hypothetical protein
MVGWNMRQRTHPEVVGPRFPQDTESFSFFVVVSPEFGATDLFDGPAPHTHMPSVTRTENAFE